MNATAVLTAEDAGFAYRGAPAVLHGVSLDITAGRSVGLVGESGAGKTTLLRLLLGLTRPTSGRILFEGAELRPRDRELTRRFRRSVQSVFQDPYSSLDPRQRVGRIVSEPLCSLGLTAEAGAEGDGSGARGGRALGIRARGARRDDPRVGAALEAVGLPADAALRYPHEFSGGQRQRVAIARATVCDPRVLLADEPVSALDVTTRVRIVDLLLELKESRGLTIAMVSHDLSVVAALCEWTAVLEYGRVVEQGDTASVLGSPSHPYTRRLIASVPRLPAADGTAG
ncbi:ABC transporter ATP-binding protein [Streptomyces corynorhini]|uniref:ABC transporter ATP-binding protein n=1 Tax=Streptomyces corynorhini TaxID=2282652 RepID=A0A370AYV9_9ACTN|nr:ATP-binding cassette domain-containing protein [Streptomyces corynorhini]RDG34778.1 ABC transporter ATP-binding protein [Streptomyces corynorhini]